jgi:hypothetical protein
MVDILYRSVACCPFCEVHLIYLTLAVALFPAVKWLFIIILKDFVLFSVGWKGQ